MYSIVWSALKISGSAHIQFSRNRAPSLISRCSLFQPFFPPTFQQCSLAAKNKLQVFFSEISDHTRLDEDEQEKLARSIFEMRRMTPKNITGLLNEFSAANLSAMFSANSTAADEEASSPPKFCYIRHMLYMNFTR